jgi:hypothetical protein
MLHEAAPEHVCATCSHKQRIVLSSSGGKKIAIVWKCHELSRRRFEEVLVEPQESCFEKNSLTDYWSLTEQTDLVW